MGRALDDLEASDIGRDLALNATAAIVALGMAICAALFAAWVCLSVLPSVIDAVTVRPAACAGLTATDCSILAQDEGW